MSANPFIFMLKASPANVLEGGVVTLKAVYTNYENDVPVVFTEEEKQKYNLKYSYRIIGFDNQPFEQTNDGPDELKTSTAGWIAGNYRAEIFIQHNNDKTADLRNLIITKIKTYLGYSKNVNVNLPPSEGFELKDIKIFSVVAGHIQAAVTMKRTDAYPTKDQALWVAIRNRTTAIGFERYQKFINCLFCAKNDDGTSFDISSLLSKSKEYENANKDYRDVLKDCLDIPVEEQALSIQGPYAYGFLKLATQVFLTLECGVAIRNDRHDLINPLFDPEQESIRLNQASVTVEDLSNRLKQYLHLDSQALPYLDRIVRAIVSLDPEKRDEVLPYCYGILQHRVTKPSLIELIWSYWQEEGMLVQTMNAITYRFQNMRSSPQDPLGELEIDPLRPLNNLLWGFIQDEHNRLTVPRRAYEYDHHYGLKLLGKAVPNMMSADSRSKFIESFHNLLYRTAIFYKEDAETTVIADAFPLLNAVKDVHLLLAEGAHNQFGDLPWTARAEMLMTQWLLSRTEMREFLRGRHMVPYHEPWMGAVDCMKKLQGWTDTSVMHFHELAVTGERIILSMRYGDWVNMDNTEDQVKNWARYWKPEIQRYIHGYQTATGVDLMAEVTDSREASQRSLQPSSLLQNRLTAQQRGQGRIPVMTGAAGVINSEVTSYGETPAIGRSRLLRYKTDE